jgi:A/G-specific adenine glycosylase
MMGDFAENVLQWFAAHGRKDLPWQQNPTPYRVWVSEIMLQQTQVATVIPYYLRFMQSFPEIDTLADADIDDVLHHWSGLGYYARARNLHQAAVIIRDRFGGEFPATFDDVVTLPGIGRSTAGAILALSREERHPILDGNVKRVLARYHAVAGWPGKTAVSRTLWKHAEHHTPVKDVAAYTQAMMDLGATICTRTVPRCDACPLKERCEAHATGQQAEFPGRREKRAKPLKKTQMILVRGDNAVFLERRPPSGIWGGLWSFPEIEPQQDALAWCEETLKTSPVDIERWPTVRHSFTHYDLDIEPTAVRVEKLSRTVADSDDRVWYELHSPQQVGIAAPVAGLIEKLKLEELATNVPNS